MAYADTMGFKIFKISNRFLIFLLYYMGVNKRATALKTKNERWI